MMVSLDKTPAVLLALCLSACGAASASPEVEKCEQHIRSQLANPASYNRVQHDSLNVGDHWKWGLSMDMSTTRELRSKARGKFATSHS
jgi:hypothetical protein